jgi:hypothetical protein
MPRRLATAAAALASTAALAGCAELGDVARVSPGLDGPPIRAGQTDCGPTVQPLDEHAYWVVVEKGRTSCIQARAVLLAFLRDERAPAGWKCATLKRGSYRDARCTGGGRRLRAYA